MLLGNSIVVIGFYLDMASNNNDIIVITISNELPPDEMILYIWNIYW